MGFEAPPQRTFGGDQYRIRSDLEGRDAERVEMGVPGAWSAKYRWGWWRRRAITEPASARSRM
jgi:hypothetical protein